MGVPTQSTRTDKVKQATATIDRHLQELATEMAQGKSARLIRYLDFCAQLHRYSFGNLILALCQRPDLTCIAGLRQWNRLGRRVKPGEKGILILAPLPVKRRRKAAAESMDTADEQPVEEEIILLFKLVYVFDVSQTEGEEVPATGDAATCLPALEIGAFKYASNPYAGPPPLLTCLFRWRFRHCLWSGRRTIQEKNAKNSKRDSQIAVAIYNGIRYNLS